MLMLIKKYLKQKILLEIVSQNIDERNNPQEDRTNLSLSAPKYIVLRYIRQKLTELQGDTTKSIITGKF